MKVRAGFVSNSSSSSFLIIGVTDRSTIREVAEEMDLYDPDTNEFEMEMGYGYEAHEHFNFYGSHNEPYYMGMDISKRIKETSYLDLCKEFHDIVKKNYNIDIPMAEIDLYYGESGDG